MLIGHNRGDDLNNPLPPRKMRTRKGNRFAPNASVEETVVVHTNRYDRLEARLRDESPSGIGLVFGTVTGLTVGQKVRAVFRRTPMEAKVRYIEERDGAFRVGLQWLNR